MSSQGLLPQGSLMWVGFRIRWDVVDETSLRIMLARIGREVNTEIASSESRHTGHCPTGKERCQFQFWEHLQIIKYEY